MSTTGHTAEYRVDLDKRPAEYVVIADDGEAFTSLADHCRENRSPERIVLHVERQADDPDERRARMDELSDICWEGESASLVRLTYAAVSHGHAADLARWDYAVSAAAHRFVKVLDAHVKNGARGRVAGWVAIRIVDGRSDGRVYADAEDARDAQSHLGRCTVFPFSAVSPMPVSAAEEHLKAMAHRPHGGCTLQGTPTCY